MEQARAILDEALKETVGISSKKWALVLVAFVVGAVGRVWLVRRASIRRTGGHSGRARHDLIAVIRV